MLLKSFAYTLLLTTALNAMETTDPAEHHLIPAPAAQEDRAAPHLSVEEGCLDLSPLNPQTLPDFDTLGIDCTAVNTLVCTHSSLRIIEAEKLRQLPNLVTAVFHDNQILSEVEPKAFASIASLKTIDLRRCALATGLSARSLESIPQLQQLYLGGNPLERLPATLSTCRDLRVLDISGSPNLAAPRFSELPNLRHLRKLEVLILDNNGLTELPVDRLPLGIGFPLRVISCANNRLTTLPEEVLEASRTENLSLNLAGNPCWTRAQEGVDAYKRHRASHSTFIGIVNDWLVVEQPVTAADIGRKVHRDIQAKVLGRMSTPEDSATVRAISHLLQTNCDVRAINTSASDAGGFVFRNRALIGMGVGFALGGGMGTVVVGLSKKIVKRIVLGGLVGAVFGGGFSLEGERAAFFAGRRGPCMNLMNGAVQASSDIKKLYKGTALTLSLFTTFKLYLLAWNAYLDWLVNYTRYQADYDSPVAGMLERFRYHAHTTESLGLSEFTPEQDFLIILNHLLAEEAYACVRSYAPEGVYDALSLGRQDVHAGDSMILPCLDGDDLSAIRDTLVSLAENTRLLRTALHNRYIGNTHDEARLYRALEGREALIGHLGAAAARIEARVGIEREVERRAAVNGTPITEGNDAWRGELVHLANCIRLSIELSRKIVA